MKHLIACLLIMFACGCATYKGVGSEIWYNQRMTELEQAKKDKAITEAEYQRSKNEIDQIRVDYISRDRRSPSTSLGFGLRL